MTGVDLVDLRSIAEAAAAGGQIEMLQWMLQHKPHLRTGVCRAAAARGNLTALQRLRERNYPWDQTMEAAARGGHLWVGKVSGNKVSSSCSSTMDCSSAVTRPEHNYPLTLQHVLVNMAQGIGKEGRVTPITPNRLVQFEGTPSLSTLNAWRQKRSAPPSDVSPKTKVGRPPKVPEPELRITGGWALSQLKKGKIVSGSTVASFVQVC